LILIVFIRGRLAQTLASLRPIMGFSIPPMIPLPFVHLYLMDRGASRPFDGQVPINALTGQVG
jgi:hypothetical protein